MSEPIIISIEQEESGVLLNSLKNGKIKEGIQNNVYGALLTRDDLIRLDKTEPFWPRIRVGISLAFLFLWIILLVSAILIIVYSPKCPARPKLEFWQSDVGYWVNPFAFKDSSGNLIGDLKGIVNGLDYIKNKIGAGYILLGSIISGQVTNSMNKIGLLEDYFQVDPAAGTMDDFVDLVKKCHKKGLKLIPTLDFNAVSISSNLAQNRTLLKKYDNTFISRFDSSAIIDIDGSRYYSAFGQPSVDLDLENRGTLAIVQNVTRFWLDQGVDGVFLANAGFYVEDGTNTAESWQNGMPESQVFTDGTVRFLQEIRKVVDEVSNVTGKQKLLMVDAGNVGYGMPADKSHMFLGTAESPAAHVVVSREFVYKRGWKVPARTEPTTSNIFTYNASSGELKESFALVTATTTDVRHHNVISLALSLLLPGSPVVFFGTELGMSINGGAINFPMYPSGLTSLSVAKGEEDLLLCELPMPWDATGFGFSANLSGSTFSNYMQSFNIVETLDSSLSFGRGQSVFSLVQKLVTLRHNPSLLWGNIEIFNGSNVNDTFQTFVRKAEGFPTFVVVLSEKSENARKVFDFSVYCETMTARLIYPSSENYPLDQPFSSKSVYASAIEHALVYVFECV